MTHGRSLSFPKLIMPRHTLDTLRPVRPRFTYLIGSSTHSSAWRPYRQECRSRSAEVDSRPNSSVVGASAAISAHNDRRTLQLCGPVSCRDLHLRTGFERTPFG